MQNFTFENPTRIIFGKERLVELIEPLQQYGSRYLFLFGEKSIKKSGLYDEILALAVEAGIELVEHGGVCGNPVLGHAEAGIEKVHEQKVDGILAVGGGSVIDEAKAIAAGALITEPLWDLYTRKAECSKGLPIISVLTLPATGSEMNGFSVLTNPETQQKLAIGGAPFLNPRVSLLDPTLTFTLNLKQTAYACADIISHLTEGYFTTTAKEMIPQDSLIEGLVRSVLESMKKIQSDPHNYEARASLMWTATLAWNGIAQQGIPALALPCHALEMPMSGIYNMAHGAGLSVITPAWMEFVADRHGERIVRFGERFFGLTNSSVADVAGAFREMYRELGAPTTFEEAGVVNPDIARLARETAISFSARGISGYEPEAVEEIYRNSL